VSRSASDMSIPKSIKQRRLHKAFLRYHDSKNWPLLREALKNMGRANLIGNGKQHLVPNWQLKEGGKDNKIINIGAPSYLMKYLGLLSPNIHSHTERIG